METYNNFKKIREIYGVTQDELAKAIGVNRTTISQWENASIKASNSNLEKLSLFFGIGPESFYELPEIDEERRTILINTSRKQKELQNQSGNERNKAEEFNQMFDSISFIQARRQFMIAMKLLLATADSASLDDLELAYEIGQKMSKRLKAIIDIRRDEDSKGDTLFDLIDKLTE